MKEIPVLEQEYIILPHSYHDGQRYVIYRKLPAWEYLRYYTDRKNEIYVDGNGEHWLWIKECSTATEANRELGELTGKYFSNHNKAYKSAFV